MTKEEFIALAAKKWDTLSEHKIKSNNLYDYEKGFDELWVEFGRETLEGSIGEVSENRRKKKQNLSRYGIISINNDNEWSIQDNLKSTPYMRDLLLYSGQEDNYETSCKHIEKYLRVKADDSQINRLCVHYGGLLEEEMTELENAITDRTADLTMDLGENEAVYGMFDGCLLPTRPHEFEGEKIGSWKEMKLGRIFRERDHLDLGKKPNVIRESIYIAHFGNHTDFTTKLEPVIDRFDQLKEWLVFINDGASWIANFIRENYPNATDILDFYHASEYLHEFSKVIFSKKEQAAEQAKWTDKQILRLLNDKVELVIEEIEKIEGGCTSIEMNSGLEAKLHSFLFEYEMYKGGSDPNGFSLLQRLEHLKNAKNIMFFNSRR